MQVTLLELVFKNLREQTDLTVQFPFNFKSSYIGAFSTVVPRAEHSSLRPALFLHCLSR